MFVPKKIKFRKCHISKVPKSCKSISSVTFGTFGIKILEGMKITSAQIETIRKTASNTLKRKGKIFIKVFPNTPHTKKSLGTRMGGGAGSLEFWSKSLAGGSVIMEMANITRDEALLVVERIKYKLPVSVILNERMFIYNNQ